MDYHMRTLPNGVRILSEHIPAMSSAALGIWVNTGSREEKASESGAAHFIEHMLFKGSEACPANRIAERMDAIGGQINAFTTKELTCFYGRALNAHLREALDILCEMFFHAKFAEEEVQTERGVILEEMGMYADDPSDLVSERLNSVVFKGSSLSRPILGKKSTLEKMTGAWLKEYKRTHYVPERIVVSVAGCFEDGILDEIEERFAQLEPVSLKAPKPAAYQSGFITKKKATEQNHLVMAFPGLHEKDERRFSMQLLSSILGGGMSSRLFQEIREKRGLCYSIYTYGACYADTGLYAVYTALNKEMEADAIRAIQRVLQEFTERGITQEELTRARELSKANVLMGLESTTAHMNHLARGILQIGQVLSPEEIIAAYDAVTCEDVKRLAEEIFDWSQVSFSAVGRVEGEAHYRALLGL